MDLRESSGGGGETERKAETRGRSKTKETGRRKITQSSTSQTKDNWCEVQRECSNGGKLNMRRMRLVLLGLSARRREQDEG